MAKKGSYFSKKDFDYEEDEYDRFKNIMRKRKRKDSFTNKARMKKFEFDYEEDEYEPEWRK